MLFFAYFMLIVWLPFVFFFFERYPVQKAVVFSFVSAWLFLPTNRISLPGFPDWGKVTATVVSVLLCTALKRSDVYFQLKPRWFDLPVILYCLCPFASAISANQGAYDGVSAVLEETFWWGLPYLIGRALLGDSSGNRMLCLGVIVGGLAYIPICLFEIRMGPVLTSLVYGMNISIVAFGLRYGGYRPMGFLVSGLELGWWMCCATLAAYMLWKSKAVKEVMGYPMGMALVALAVVSLACKATGALLQLGAGLAVIHLAKMMKSSILLWLLLMIPPAYCITRTTGSFTGETLVDATNSMFDADRAQSVAFRFNQEEVLIRSALGRPVFGWARGGGFNVPDKPGQKGAIADGLWIITFGWMGGAGLAALNAMLLLPAAIFARKIKPKDWFNPEVAPVTSLTLILPLFMIDNLSNAMLNPIYPLAMGAVNGYLATYSARRVQGTTSLDESHDLAAVGLSSSGAPGVFATDSELAPATAAFEDRRFAEAIHWLDDQLDDYHREFRRRPSGELLMLLGRAHALRARCYARLEQPARSIEERMYLVGLVGQYASLLDQDPLTYPEFADNLNDLAWSLLAAQPAEQTAIEQALSHAARVVEAHPEVGAYWNTLGVARYRAGDYLAAIMALSRSVNLSPGQGSPFDFYYLALANHQLGYRKPAEAWLSRAEDRDPAELNASPELASLRDEAASQILARSESS